MATSRSRFAHCLLGLTLSAGCAREPAATSDQPSAAVQAEVLSALSTSAAPEEPEVDVIVNFHELLLKDLRADGQRAAIAALQTSASTLEGFTVTRRFSGVPALAGRVTREALERLRKDPNVAFIQLDGEGGGQLKEAVPAIGGDKVKSLYGLTGKGVRVAVLDTGIDLTHPDLRDAVVGQHCFTRNACPPLRTAEGTSAQDDHGHGSNATGIIASNGVVSSPGFAPDTEVVAVKVNDQNDSGFESDWVAGLDWIYQNLGTLKVQAVNLSLGSTVMHADQRSCEAAHPALARAIKNLVGAGVTVFAASGNRGSTTMMPAPACLPGPIVVGATYDSDVGAQPPGNSTYSARFGAAFGNCSDRQSGLDRITCFTNSTSRMDLVAPGAPIVSDSLRGRTEMYWGTSQACPAAVGVASLMLQCNPGLTPAQVRELLVTTGAPIVDAKNGLTFPSLRALAAVEAACPTLKEGSTPVERDAGAGVDASVPRDAGTTPRDAGVTRDASVARDAGGAADAAPPLVRRDAGAARPDAQVPDDEGSDDPDTRDEPSDESAIDEGATGSRDVDAHDDEAPSKGAGTKVTRAGGCSLGDPASGAPLAQLGSFAMVLMALRRRRRGTKQREA